MAAGPGPRLIVHARRAIAALGVVFAIAGLPAPVASVTAGPALPLPPGPDAQLERDLDGVVGASPADTCLVVSIDGVEVYGHRGGDRQIPASTQKLATAGAALHRLGPDHRYRTELRTTAPVDGGTVAGDVHLVGSGDPVLVSSFYRAVRQLPEDRPLTLLDGIVDDLLERGVRRIDGRVVGDESRYDQLRTVPSWPERYAAEDQAGPLSALTVDGAFTLELDDEGTVIRRRAPEPAVQAAETLVALLRSRGIEVVGGAAAGTVPAGAAAIAGVESPPLQALTDDLLRRSDNQMAELLLKELAAAEGQQGSTEGGARLVAGWEAEQGTAAAGSYVVDGSGLDRGNQVTCSSLVGLLAADGPDGVVSQGLPVAGESGTLRARFRDTAAVGVLAAKTGSLSGVTSLAGHVALPDGGTATFAYVVNGEQVTAEVLRAQDLLAQVLATFEPACPDDAAPIVAPVVAQAAGLGAIGAAGAGLALPAVAASFGAVEGGGGAVVDRCTEAAGSPIALGAR